MFEQVRLVPLVDLERIFTVEVFEDEPAAHVLQCATWR
jgi:hypothetical protein